MIKVVDSIMGSGKSSAAINLMNKDKENNYIYITPYLSEVARVKKESTRRFYEPKVHSKDGQILFKQEAFHELLREKKNIVSTHSLFLMSNEETKELIYANDYILILDEVMDVVKQITLKEHDLESMLALDFIRIDPDTGLVTWNEDKKHKSTAYDYIKNLCKNKSLYVYKDDMFMWTFPVHIFESFKDVYILTYLFDAQIQKYYYDFHKLDYEYYYATDEFGEYIFIQGIYDDRDVKEKLKGLIDVYEGNLNKIGDLDFSLSKSWYSKRKDSLTVLKNNTENYFKNIVKAKSKDIIWTTFKNYEPDVKGRGYSRSFIPLNLRATNDYMDRHYLAYTVNLFMNPVIKKFFYKQGVETNEDLYAISELLQWIWRSAIRNDEKIYLYLPSKRMRELFFKWLNNEKISS